MGDERSMAFQIIFYKTLLNSNGYPHRTTQGMILVSEAITQETALEIAKCQFADQRRYPRWDYCADEAVIEEVSA
jgi:hypothetical protein